MGNTHANLNEFKFVPGNLEQVLTAYESKSISRGTPIHLVNSFTLYCAARDRELAKILKSDVLLTDGKPLFKYLQLKNKEIKHFRGPDLMRETLAVSDGNQRHFFLGGTENSIKKLITNIEVKFPKNNICGYLAPPFSNDLRKQINKIAAEVNLSDPTTIWVSLGTPKQDYFVHELAKYTPARIYAVGAAFDFISEDVGEAPPWIRALYLEWLFRFTRQPKRLAKRYLLGNPYFIFSVIQDLIYSVRKL